MLVSYANNVFFPYIYNVNGPSSDYELQDGYSGQGTSPVDFTSVGAVAGDLNGDGVQDIVMMNPSNPNFPANPAHDAITLLMGTLYSTYYIPDLIAAPVGDHTLVAGYVPATGSIYAPGQSTPVVVPVPQPGVASFAPESLNFGNVTLGQSVTKAITLTDTGTGNLGVTSDFFSLGGLPYQITSDSCAGTLLEPNETCSISITFSPVSPGPYPAQITVSDTAIDSPQSLSINGSGSGLAANDTSTTIVLTASNTAPQYVTPSTGGAATALNPVLLTATVTVTATGVPVTGGLVTFYDNPGVPGAVGPSVIGSTALQFPVGGDVAVNGVATMQYAFGPGPHSLTAAYSGTPVGPPAGYGFAPATTASAVSLTSTGYATEQFGFQLLGNEGTIAYFSPSSGNTQINYITGQDPVYTYPFMVGFGLQLPTGTTTTTDQTTNIVYPMMGDDYADLTYNSYVPVLAAGSYIYSLPESGVGYYFTADVFQSGVPALVTLSATQNAIWTNNLYSNPNGYPGCQGGSPNNLCAVTTPPVQGLAADVNGDGAVDLVIAHNDPTGNGSIGVLTNTVKLPNCPNAALSNQPCAFGSPEATYATGHPEAWVQVGDVNGDGFPDIVAVSSDGTNLISVLQNNGDGTFTSTGNTYQAGGGAGQFYLTDLNQDGILDVAVLNATDQTIGILLGNGDGTFQTMVPYPVGTNPTSFAVGDLNVDGFPDFAITNNDSPTQAEVSFLYGTGGGGFNYVSNLALNQLYMYSPYVETNPSPTVITVTDLNGDGYPDLFIGFNINQYTYATWNPTQGKYIYGQTAYGDEPNGINVRTNSLPVADLDGDGVKDSLFMPLINNNISCTGCSPSNNNLMVRLTGSMQYGWAGPTLIDSPAGNHTFYSNYTPPANSIYLPAAAGPITIPIGAEPIMTLTPTELDFGLVQIGTAGETLPLNLKNTGNATATSLSFSIAYQVPAGTDFSVSAGNCGASLAPGASCQPTVIFAPGTATSFVGYVNANFVGTIPGSSTPAQTFLTGTGSVNPVGHVNVGETIHLTDTVSASIGTPINVGETIHLTDTVSASLGHAVSVNETIHLTDTASASLGHAVNVNETIHLTDTVSASTVVVINDVEAIHVTDTDKPLLSVAINDLEAIHVTDTDKPLLSVAINDLEAIHVTDAPATSVSTYNDTTKLSVSATTVTVGGSVALTATVTESGTATIPTGTVNFFDGGTMIGSATLAGGTASYTESNLSSGTHTLTAMYLGNSVFPASSSASVMVTTTSQTILTVTANSFTRNFGAANPTLTYGITGFTGGDTIAVVTGSATVTTTAIPTSPAGSYPITASIGSLGAPAKYVFSFASGTLTVNGNATETITFAALPNISRAAVPHETLTAHSTSGSLGQPIVFMVTGPATIAGNVLTITGTGTVTVTATQAGNSTFAPAVNVVRTFMVTP